MKKHGIYKYMLLYFFIFTAIGALTPLIGQYLSEIRFSGVQIGIITSAGTFTSIFASPFWGRRYALVQHPHLLVTMLCLCAVVVAMVVKSITLFPIFVIGYVALYFFQAPITSLSDALTVGDGQPFGIVRMFGAIGFSLAVFVTARLASAMGLRVIFMVYAVAFVIAAVLLYSMHRAESCVKDVSEADDLEAKANTCKAEASAPTERTDKDANDRMFRRLLKNRNFVLLVVCAFFVNGTDIANNTFFSFLYMKGGGTLAGVGIAFLLMAGSEAPFMAWTHILSRKFGKGPLLLVAMVVAVARFAWYATGPSHNLLLAFFVLQGIMNGITLVEFVKFVADLVPKELCGPAIALYYAIGSNASTIVCQMIGGVALDRFGATGVYFCFAVFNAIGLVIFLASGLWKKRPTDVVISIGEDSMKIV